MSLITSLALLSFLRAIFLSLALVGFLRAILLIVYVPIFILIGTGVISGYVAQILDKGFLDFLELLFECIFSGIYIFDQFFIFQLVQFVLFPADEIMKVFGKIFDVGD